MDVHSLVLDFAAVSFLDISALKGLKTVSQVTTTGGQFSQMLVFKNNFRMYCTHTVLRWGCTVQVLHFTWFTAAFLRAVKGGGAPKWIGIKQWVA